MVFAFFSFHSDEKFLHFTSTDLFSRCQALHTILCENYITSFPFQWRVGTFDGLMFRAFRSISSKNELSIKSQFNYKYLFLILAANRRKSRWRRRKTIFRTFATLFSFFSYLAGIISRGYILILSFYLIFNSLSRIFHSKYFIFLSSTSLLCWP